MLVPLLGIVEENQKKDAREALKPHMQPGSLERDTLIKVDDTKKSSTEAKYSQPVNMDQLTQLVQHVLMDKHLEVSKVRPFFWSMVEAYVDRFQRYPFDIVRALFSYLETNDYPPDLIRELVKKLEDCYETEYGEPINKSTQLVFEHDDLDYDVKELRESLKYAALVDEFEEV